MNFRHFTPSQVRHQYDGGDQKYLDEIVKMSEQKNRKYGENFFGCLGDKIVLQLNLLSFTK